MKITLFTSYNFQSSNFYLTRLYTRQMMVDAVRCRSLPITCRHGSEASVRRMPPPHHRQIPAQSHRLPLARGVCAVRGVRRRAPELLLSAGLQTLLQAGLCGVSTHLYRHFSPRGRKNLLSKSSSCSPRSRRRGNKESHNNLSNQANMSKSYLKVIKR